MWPLGKSGDRLRSRTRTVPCQLFAGAEFSRHLASLFCIDTTHAKTLCDRHALAPDRHYMRARVPGMFFILGSMDRYLASRALAHQTSVMVRGLKETVAGTRRELEQLPPIKGLNCQNGASDVLAQQAFDNPYVRWLGVRQAGVMICRSGLVNRDPGPAGQVHPIDDVWSVMLAEPILSM